MVAKVDRREAIVAFVQMREGMLEFDLGQRLAFGGSSFGGSSNAAFQSITLQANLNQILRQQQRTARKIELTSRRFAADASGRVVRRLSEPFNLVVIP